MGLISKAAVLGVGYLLGARAGRERYDQVVDVVSRAAARPELAPYLTPVVTLLSEGTGRPESAAPATGLAATPLTTDVDTAAGTDVGTGSLPPVGSSAGSAQPSPAAAAAAAAGDSTATAPVDLSPPLPDPPPAASGGAATGAPGTATLAERVRLAALAAVKVARSRTPQGRR